MAVSALLSRALLDYFQDYFTYFNSRINICLLFRIRISPVTSKNFILICSSGQNWLSSRFAGHANSTERISRIFFKQLARGIGHWIRSRKICVFLLKSKHRLLNPKEIKNSEKIFTFWQIFKVWSLHQPSNMIIVVSKWCHNVTWKSGCFPAPERGGFPKNSKTF